MHVKILSRYAVLAAIFVASAGVVHAEDTPNPAPSVAEILAKTPDAQGIFVTADAGAARHVQSGLTCPLSFPNLNLWHLEVFAADGTDVGCDYGRNGADNVAVSKLTIYATKAQPGDTVDKAFARYQAEVKNTWPDAKVLGPAIEFGGNVSEEDKGVRSEEYQLVFKGGHKSQSDLIVTIKNGWVIEIRGTTATDVTTGEDGAKAVADFAAPAVALMQALSTIGTAPASQ